MSDAQDFAAPTEDELPPPPGPPQATDASPVATPAPASWLLRHAAQIDTVLYASFAGVCVLYVALVFYGSMHAQTRGVWSAPLDDVFIHFDYARAIARGYPLQWSEGNGYSSGNTSLTYPFVLAFGYWIHPSAFRDLLLMKWAAMLACGCVLGFLLGAARWIQAADPKLPSWTKYLLPPAVLGLGALDWTLFSGMENAFHLAMWSLASLPVLAFFRWNGDPTIARRLAWLAGVSGALLFATRPESVACVASSAVFAALMVRRRSSARAAAATFARVALPGSLVFAGHTIANRVYTGEWSANGAIAKLALNNPYMTAGEKWSEYLHFLKYVILRNTQHHFADRLPWGWLVPLVALVPLLHRRTRAAATLLWAQVVGWLLLVSLNGQVRWQNERYTMAAVAWLLLLAALGLGLMLHDVRQAASRWWQTRAGWLYAARVLAGVSVIGTFVLHQLPNMRDQIWFFGRASRNIFDQHVTAGRELKRLDARRVLVGDAGALTYASDRPGLDLIGLGGYERFPFARATVHGLGASIELIERMPREERPDVMAIYPSWWGDLPLVFGQQLSEFPVTGNVICGDTVKVIYRADWGSLDRTGRPRSLAPGEVVVDEIDVADLMSERAHDYVFPRPSAGFVDWRVLPDPGNRARDLFDAGRIIPPGRAERFRVKLPARGGRLVVRTTAAWASQVQVRIDGADVGVLRIEPTTGWHELSLELAPRASERSAELALSVQDREWTNFHLWVIGGP